MSGWESGWDLSGLVDLTSAQTLTGVKSVQNSTSWQANAAGDISGRSFTASASGPYGAFLRGGDVAENLPTPQGILNGQAWDWGGVVFHGGQFGILCDGVTINTEAVQDLSDFITNNSGALSTFLGVGSGGLGARGVFGPGVCLIDAGINIANRAGWSFHGGGTRSTTVIKQMTANTPCFIVGASGGGTAHGWGFDGLYFDYGVATPSTDTGAVPIHFAGSTSSTFGGYVTNCIFAKGCYGMDAAAGGGPWGCRFDGLHFGGGLTKGAIDFHLSGGPNNKWGHIYVSADSMIGPIFNLSEDTLVADSIEFNSVTNAQLLNMGNGSSAIIGSFRIETATWSATTTLVNLGVNCRLHIGRYMIYPGGVPDPTNISGAGTIVTALKCDHDSAVTIDFLDLGLTNLTGGALAHAVQCGTAATQMPVKIRHLVLNGGWDLEAIGVDASMATLWVEDWNLGFLSTAQGDADYTVTNGSPNKVTVETAFTAIRSFNLPSVLNNMHTGQYYEFRFYGAINGANTALIKCNGATLATLATDKVCVGFTCSRRSVSVPQSNWIMTKYEVLP